MDRNIQDEDTNIYGATPPSEDGQSNIYDVDSEPLYTIDDEDENENENYAACADPSARKDSASAMGLMFRILATPVEGWKALKRARMAPETVASRCFYPFVALASVSEFANLFYLAESTVSSILVAAVNTFISFFFGYFLVLMCAGILMPKEVREQFKKPFGKEFVMEMMSTLALFYALGILLPMAQTVLVFLPLWTIYAISKGVRFLRGPKEAETRSACVLSLLIVGAPILCHWLFSIFLPSM